MAAGWVACAWRGALLALKRTRSLGRKVADGLETFAWTGA